MKAEIRFYNYFKTLYYTAPSKPDRGLVLLIIYAALFGMVLSAFTDSGTMMYFLVGFMAFFCSYPIYLSRMNKPNLNSMAPVSSNRKRVYTLASALLLFAVFVLIAAAVVFEIMFITTVTLCAVLGVWSDFRLTFFLYTQGIRYTFSELYSALIFVFTVIFILGAGIIFAHTDSKKYRHISTVSLWALSYAGALTLVQLTFGYGGASSSWSFSADVGWYLKYLPYPWIAITLIAVISLATFAFGVYLIIVKNKPKNY